MSHRRCTLAFIPKSDFPSSYLSSCIFSLPAIIEISLHWFVVKAPLPVCCLAWKELSFLYHLQVVSLKPRWLLLNVTGGCIQIVKFALPQLPTCISYLRFSARERKWGRSPSGLQLFRLCHSSLPILSVLAAFSCLSPHVTFAVLRWQLNCHKINLV